MAKKVNALCPNVREQECHHDGGFPWSGRVPCTGVQRCTMCGTLKDDVPCHVCALPNKVHPTIADYRAECLPAHRWIYRDSNGFHHA